MKDELRKFIEMQKFIVYNIAPHDGVQSYNLNSKYDEMI